MAQAPDPSGELSQQRDGSAGLSRRAIERAVAPTARKTKAYYDTMSFSAAGIELGLSVVIGALGGHYLDGRLGCDPFLMLLFTVAGFAAGVRAMLRAGRRATRNAREASQP